MDVQEPNMYNREGYNKWGIYKPGWKEHPELTNVTMRKIWHDNIRIGFSRDSVDPDQFRWLSITYIFKSAEHYKNLTIFQIK